MTEVASRFTAGELARGSEFVTEENAYEPLVHPRKSRGDDAGAFYLARQKVL